MKIDEPHETREWKFSVSVCADENELRAFYEKMLGLSLLRLKKWTLEEGEKIEFNGEKREISVVSPSGKPIGADKPLTETGLYKIDYGNGIRLAEACVYVRPSSDYYLKAATKSALDREEFSSADCETYYGFYPIFSYLARVEDEDVKAEAIKRLDKFLSVSLTPRATLTDTVRVYSDRAVEVAAFGERIFVPAGEAVTVSRPPKK